jgi:predicted membrane-bound spermidine synthase
VRQAGLRILLLGAGDGLAAREVLKYGAAIDAVDLVDLDPFVTQL